VTYGSTITGLKGGTRYIITKKSTFRKADGTVGGIIGVITDITELKKAEKALKESEARFRNLSEASLEAVIFIENGVIIDVNHRVYEMFGYKEAEVLNRSVVDFVAQGAQKDVRNRINSRNEEKYETIGIKKDGTMFPIEIHPKELHLKGKKIRILVVRDLTDQKHMEEEVLKSKNLQSVGTLAGGIAHDFNNLLMAIVGNISLAKMGISGNEKSADYLTEAERIALLGKNLTHQLLTFSRGGDPVRRIVSIGNIVQDVTERILSGPMFRTRYLISEELYSVEADEDQIRQVIQNIVINARDAMPSGGTVAVVCDNVKVNPQDKLPLIKEDYVRVSIHDEGSGIPEEIMSNIFDPYFTTKGMGSQKGVGLGLAISYSIVRKHSGYINVESSPEKGTTFQIYLPAHKTEAADLRVKEPAAGYGKGRVLLMDDEEMILKVSQELLQHMGYEVTAARNGEEAVGFYRQAMELKKPFDAVVLDLVIPDGLGGKEVIQELAAIDPQVRGIVSSGYLNDPIIQDYKGYGFAGTLTKPYDARELDDKLQRVIKTGSS
jgi:two-component system, cell cycle sensor histidine kinase and response regulator CckA